MAGHLKYDSSTGHLIKSVSDYYDFSESICPCTSDADWQDLQATVIEECGGLVNQYAISGYSDGDISSSGCLQGSIRPVWDGKFGADTVAYDPRCKWGCNGTYSVDDTSATMFLYVIKYADGHLVREGTDYLLSWVIRIYCNTGDMWLGVLENSSTPVGVYQRISGSSAVPSSITIIEDPY